MAKKKKPTTGQVGRRACGDEFKEEAGQMLLDGHSASSVVERLGISNTNVLYRWKKDNWLAAVRLRVHWRPVSRS